MFRRTSVAIALFCAFGAAAGAGAAAEAKRPNVLFLIADDLNNLLGCYGDPLAKTPNIDRLAARGVVFERAYCTFPLCAPSRNSFLTGLYPNSAGILANAQVFRQTIPSQVSMPQAFRLSGYFAARIGKLTDDLRRQCRQAYYASISFMDAQVGKVVDALDRLGLSGNTVIVFTSDHGYHTGEHGLWQKMSLFEETRGFPFCSSRPACRKPEGLRHLRSVRSTCSQRSLSFAV